MRRARRREALLMPAMHCRSHSKGIFAHRVCQESRILILWPLYNKATALSS